MTDKEIVIMAQNDAREKRRTVLPEGFGSLETMLYNQIYYLCRDYDEGAVPKDEARKLKTKYLQEYGRICLKREIYSDHMRRMVTISQVLGDVEKNGCERCKRAARVFDGREPVRDTSLVTAAPSERWGFTSRPTGRTSDKIHGVLVEVIRKAKRDYSQDYTDRTEDDYIAEAIMDAGFYERVGVQE